MGTSSIQVQASNVGGTTSRTLAITIAAPVTPVPAISSATTASVDAGNLFNYRIQATGATSYSAQGLPTGLTVDSSTGVITGRVSLARTYQITLLAINASGSAYATLTLDVRGNSSFAPANDNFANRITLSGAAVSTTGANNNASAESGETAHAGSPAATSVWWSWIAPSSGTLTLSTAGSVPAMRIALYTGGTVSSHSAVASTTVGTSTFAVTSGTTYHVAIDSIANRTGSISLSLSLSAPPTSRPANDNFAAAIVLTGSSANASAVTTAATAEIGESSHGSSRPAAKSVWYKWTAPAAGLCTVNTRGSDFDTLLAIYTGTAVNALTLVASDDDNGGNSTSEASFSTVAGAVYNIAVDGYAAAAGNVSLGLIFTAGASVPANDNFADATILTGSVASANGSNGATSRQTGEPAHASNRASHSVWFRWTAPSSGLVFVSTIGSSFDTVLAVYTGSTLASLQPVSSDDDSGGNSTSLVGFNATTGTVYSFAVDGYSGVTGNYALNLLLSSGAPANDSFSTPATLLSDVRAAALNTLATVQAGELAHFPGTAASKSLWWRWTATSTGFVSVTTAGSTFDTVLAVYTGTALNALTTVAQNNEASYDDSTSTVFFRAVAGRAYLIAVDGYYSSAFGTIALTLTPSTNPSTVYATDFERFTPGSGQLVKQDQWSEINASSATNAQGVLTQGFPGQGHSGYIGYGNPDFSSSTATSAFVFRSLNFDPIAEGAPIVQMRTDISIIGSTNGRNDIFYFILYNRAGAPLAGFRFDTESRRAYAFDGSTISASSFTFSFNTRYTVLGTFNFATRRWTARIGSTDLVADSIFAGSATAVDVGDFTFGWSLRDSQRRPGDNFMIFDNLAITADPAPAAVPAIQLPTAPSGSLTAPLTYNVSATNGPILSYSAAGLPSGLTLNSITGLVTGTPTQAGTFNVNFTATNSRGQSATTSATFTILAGPPAITSTATATATLDRTFLFQITATNYPRRFGLRGTAALPSGLSLDTNTGMISGTPRAVGRYQLTLSADNDAGAGTAPLELTVDAVAPVITLLPASQTVIAGSTSTFTVVATGTPPFTYQWSKNGAAIFGADKGSLTIGGVQSSDAGIYIVVVGNVAGFTTSMGATLAVTLPGRLINLSVLTDIVTAGDDFTLGYVVGGTNTSGAKPLVIRAAGPSLGALGVLGTLDDPKLELFAGSTFTGGNDNWGGSAQLTAALAAVGAFAYTGPLSKDAATTANITTRDNSVKVSAVGSGRGTVIAEIYDATSLASFTTATPRLINVSVRKHLGSLLTMGFVVGGSTSAKVLVRGIGPTLGAFGVPGTVADPQLTLFNSSSVKIGENNDWGGTAPLTAAFASVGAFALPSTSKDAALLVTLAPGNYTAQVTGVNGTTGVALVEVYEVP